MSDPTTAQPDLRALALDAIRVPGYDRQPWDRAEAVVDPILTAVLPAAALAIEALSDRQHQDLVLDTPADTAAYWAYRAAITDAAGLVRRLAATGPADGPSEPVAAEEGEAVPEATSAPDAAAADWVRVVAVVNWRQRRVHGLTCDNAEAQKWVREIVAQHDGDPLAATMTPDVVSVAAQEAPPVVPAPEAQRAAEGVRELAVDPNTWVSFPGLDFAVAWRPVPGAWYRAYVRVVPHAQSPAGAIEAAEPLAPDDTFDRAVTAACSILAGVPRRDVAEALRAAGRIYEADDETAIDRMLAETMFAGMDIDHGVKIRLRMAAELQTGMVRSLKTWLDTAGAENYVEQTVTDRETGGVYVVTVQRPGGKTPHALRREAEADRDEWKRRATELQSAANLTLVGWMAPEGFIAWKATGQPPLPEFSRRVFAEREVRTDG